MDCYECAIRNKAIAAVATCRQCGVGLCLEHLTEAQSYRPGGTTFGCPHDLSLAGQHRVAASVPGPNGRVGVPVGPAR